MNWFIEGLKAYAVFSGRASRKAYWNFFLVYLIVSIVATALDAIIGKLDMKSGFGPISGLFYLGTLLPSTGIAVRRLHDTDRRGWWVLVLLLPLVGLVWYCVLLARAGTPGPNRFGDVPPQEA